MKALDEYFLKCSCRCWTKFILFLQILCLNLNRETWRWKGKSTVLINHFWLWLHKQCCIPFASNSFKWAAKTTDSTRNWNATFETSRIEKWENKNIWAYLHRIYDVWHRFESLRHQTFRVSSFVPSVRLRAGKPLVVKQCRRCCDLTETRP